jgi:hypothetical protein
VVFLRQTYCIDTEVPAGNWNCSLKLHQRNVVEPCRRIEILRGI